MGSGPYTDLCAAERESVSSLNRERRVCMHFCCWRWEEVVRYGGTDAFGAVCDVLILSRWGAHGLFNDVLAETRRKK